LRTTAWKAIRQRVPCDLRGQSGDLRRIQVEVPSGFEHGWLPRACTRKARGDASVDCRLASRSERLVTPDPEASVRWWLTLVKELAQKEYGQLLKGILVVASKVLI
jgi:hypothetical protein